MGSSSSSSYTYPAQRSSQNRPASTSGVSTAASRPLTNAPMQTVPTLSLPGAYSITPQTNTGTSAPARNYRITIPDHVQPNQTFRVFAGNQVVQVRCPPQARPGQMFTISVPPEATIRPLSISLPQLTSAYGDDVGGGYSRMNSDISRRNQDLMEDAPGATTTNETENSLPAQPQQPTQPQHRQFNVVIPPNIREGMDFPVSVEGRRVMVRCPAGAGPGTTVRISLPTSFLSPPPAGMQVATDLNRPPETNSDTGLFTYSVGPPPTVYTQTFDVTVPPGIRPNDRFLVMAAGQRVLVTCPPNATTGSHVRFNLAIRQPDRPKDNLRNNSSILSYETNDGWSRSIRLADMKFIWIRIHADGTLDSDYTTTTTTSSSSSSVQDGVTRPRFHIEKSAYVRNIIFLQGNDTRMRTGRLSLVPASHAATTSSVFKDNTTTEIISYSELVATASLPYKDKMKAFRTFCKRLETPWEQGHLRIHVRRSSQYFLDDSIKAVMSLSPTDFLKIWRFEFIGEDGIDAGGLAREWFHLVTKAVFDPDRGLWLNSPGANQTKMHLNAASGLSCPEDHLIYFRFLGRVCGKALFDEQLIAGHMVDYLYKHLLGWPVTFQDLQSADENVYTNLKKLCEMESEDITNMCLDFTLQEETLLGVKNEVELVKDGKNIEVTAGNLPYYLEANLKYRLMDKILPQLTELLLGFFDVIPEALVTIFDFRELELAMCGVPEINVKDWMENTNYSGTFSIRKERHPTCAWFWDIVLNDFDQEMRAKLLQFVTGTSGVPARGFSVLQGNDGNIKLFTMNGIDSSPTSFPRSHTCFNRLDLPSYNNRNDLRERLKIAITHSATGFQMQ